MRQAIVTKYLGPTDTRGSRFKATAAGGSVTIPNDYSDDAQGMHRKAAMALAAKLGWLGEWEGGAMPDGSGYVFVNPAGLVPTFKVPGSDDPSPA